MIERYVAATSTYAGDIDGLITLIFVLVGVWFLVCEGVFFYLIFRFRAKDGVKAEYITGDEKHQKRWISIPHALVLVCDVFIIVGAVQVWYNVKQHLPEEDLTVRVIGQQWAWTFVHPGEDEKIDTADDIALVDELRLEVGRNYYYKLESKDVLHNFSVPSFRLKQDTIPGRVITGWFQPTKTGEYGIQCAEICGIGHGLMGARLIIESEEEHTAWIRANTTAKLAATTPVPADPAATALQ